MSKMSELSRQTEQDNITYINSLCEQEPEYVSSCCDKQTKTKKGIQMNYMEALEKAIILLVDNPNITDEAGGFSDCGIVDNDKEIAETLQQLRNKMARRQNG
tara:strand:+ start:1131 stop:1436 length:306 start_codon:yes stop_codon:yes gene_type:complete